MTNEIKDILGDEELFAQLAEECCELAQAALKMRRALNGKNWTPKTVEECRNDIIEEHADLCLCFKALMWDDKEARKEWEKRKEERWMNRLREHN